MTTFLLFAIYVGGAEEAHRRHRARGVGRATALGEALAWPIDLGRALAAWAIENRGEK